MRGEGRAGVQGDGEGELGTHSRVTLLPPPFRTWHLYSRQHFKVTDSLCPGQLLGLVSQPQVRALGSPVLSVPTDLCLRRQASEQKGTGREVEDG